MYNGRTKKIRIAPAAFCCIHVAARAIWHRRLQGPPRTHGPDAAGVGRSGGKSCRSGRPGMAI
jgi:hypothetical protein